MSISCIIITKNEETNIEACLKAVSWCQEIIVVDSGSTDRTQSIVESHNARFVTHPFNGYGRQKNFACSLVKHPWILSVDADEVLSVDLRNEIQLAISNPSSPDNGYSIPRRFSFLGRTFKHGSGSVDYPIRLFKVGFGHFSDDVVHEKLIVKGSVGRLRGEMVHYSYTSLDQYLTKFNSYTSFAAQQIIQDKSRRSVILNALRIPLEFFRFYILKLNILNGAQGLVWSVLSAFYPFVKVAKARFNRTQ